jgi:hypothetical protein
MKTAKTVWFLALSWTLLYSVQAESADVPRPSLKGLRAVKLNISVSNSLVNGGAPGKQLRTQMELRLRNAGLQVDNTLTQPVLYMEVTGFQVNGTNNFAYYVSLQLTEVVKVARNGEDVFATVWGPNIHVLHSLNLFQTELYNNAIERTDEFINNWLQANPRSPPPPPSGAESLAAAALKLFAPSR